MDFEVAIVTQTYPTTKELSLHTKYDARTIRERPNDSVLLDGIHYLHPSKSQVREDKGFYIPDLLSDAQYDANPKAYAAFADHDRHLHKAEGLLGEAWNLVRLMLAALGDEGDSRAMQTEAGMKVIEKKLSKAHTQIDKQHTRHTNLYLAYFDLKDKADEGEQD